MVTRRAASRPRASSRGIWLALPVSLAVLPVVWVLTAAATTQARPAVLLALLGAAILAAVLTRPVSIGGFPGGMLVVAARSPAAAVRAVAVASTWMAIGAGMVVVALIVTPGWVPHVYLGLLNHAAVAAALHVLTSRMPSRAIRHRRLSGVVRLPAAVPQAAGWKHVVEAIEAAHEARTEPLYLAIVDRDGSPVLSAARQPINGPCELRVREADWLQSLLGFRYVHYTIDLAQPGKPANVEVELDDLCTVVRMGRPRDFLRLASGRSMKSGEAT